VKPYDFLGKLADDDTIMNKMVFSDEATFHLSDVTPMDFLLWGFVKDNVYVPPLPTTLMSSTHGSERPVQTMIRKFPTTCGRRLNIGFMLLEPLVALTMGFIHDKLLFIKLFQSVFRLVRVL
jgi:hypothetical protein